MKYFLHDTNALQDEKLTELFMQFGYEGIGLFYCALERIAAQEKPIKTEVLKTQLRVGKRLEKCWSFMESLGILSSSNGETFNERILSYSEKYEIKKQKNRERISRFRDNHKDGKNVTRYEQDSNAPKVKRSKVKERKVNTYVIEEGSVGPFEFNELNESWKKWLTYRRELKKPITLTAAETQIEFLQKFPAAVAVEIINQSIRNQWQGLFELKKQVNATTKSKQPTADDLREFVYGRGASGTGL